MPPVSQGLKLESPPGYNMATGISMKNKIQEPAQETGISLRVGGHY